MSIVGTKLKPFQATAFHQGKFVDVSDADVARVVDAFRGVLSVDPAAGVAQ